MKKEKHNSIRNINSYFRKQTKSPFKSKVTCSIKPIIYENPKDLNIKSIFYNMILLLKNENYLNYYKKLNNNEKTIRTSFLKIMKQFIISNKINNRISLLSIYIYDILIKKNNNELTLEQLGLGALILVTKFFYEKDTLIHNNNFKNFNLNSKDYSFKDLSLLEIKCLQILNYNLNYINPINFLDLFFLNGIIFTSDNLNKEDSRNIYQLSNKLIEYFMAINNEYSKFHPFIFVCSIISLCREINNLEKWPECLESIFHISFSDFEEVFIYLKELYKDIKQNNDDINKVKSISLEKINNNIKIYNDINLNMEKSSFKNDERIKFDNDDEKIKEKEKEKNNYNSPIKKNNKENNKSPFNYKTPVKGNKNINYYLKNNNNNTNNNNNNLYNNINNNNNIDNNNNNIKIINNYSCRQKNLFLNSNTILEDKERIKNNIKKLNQTKNLGEIFRKKLTNNTTNTNTNTNVNVNVNGNDITITKSYKKKTEPLSRNINNNLLLNTFNSDGINYISDETKQLKNNHAISTNNIKEKNEKSRNNPSLENYKRFNITMNNQIPHDLLEKRVKNLGLIVNHLLSNQNNNIL